MPYELDPNTNTWQWVGNDEPPADVVPPQVDAYFENKQDWQEAGSPTNVVIGLPPKGTEYTKPEANPTTIRVGVQTESPEVIEYTEAIKDLRREDPVKFDILRREGTENYRRAVNADRFVAQQEGKVAERVAKINKVATDKAQATEKLSAKEFKEFEAKNVKLPGGDYIPDDEFKKIPAKYANIGLTQGYEKMQAAIDADNKAADLALKELEPYKVKGGYDVIRYLKDDKAGQASWKATQLEAAGFTKAEITDLQKESAKPFYQATYEGVKQQLSTPKGATTLAADFTIPFYATSRRWADSTGGEKAWNLVLDAAMIAGYVGGVGPVVGAARGAATISRTAMLTAAARAIGRDLIAQGKAPFTIIAHPLATAKATANAAMDIAENIVDPRKISYMVLATSKSTTRIPIGAKFTAAEAMAARDLAMETFATKGGKVAIQTGDYLIEIKESAFMAEARKAGGALATATPDIAPFKTALKVELKTSAGGELKPPKEQGLFFAQEPLERFAESSAFGTVAKTKPGFYIVSQETAAKMRSSGKIYNNTAELERVLPVGETTAGARQKLYTRLANGERAEILLEKPLSVKQLLTLKAKAVPAGVKSLYTTAFEIKGINGTTLTPEEIRLLTKELAASGNVDQARGLREAASIARSRAIPTTARAAARVIPGTTDRAAIREARSRFLAGEDVTRVARLPARTSVTDRGRELTTEERRTIAAAGREAVRVLGNREVTPAERARAVEAARLKATREIDSVREAARVKAERAAGIPRASKPTRIQPIGRTARVTTPDRIIRPPTTDSVDRVVRPPDITRPPRVPREPRKPSRPPKGRVPIISAGKTEKQNRDMIQRANGAIGWRQGELHGKDRWDVITNIYKPGAEQYVIVMGDKPQGATIVKGPGSAFRTAQMLYGKKPLPRTAIIDQPGLFTTRLDPLTGKRIRISFEHDANISKRGTVFPLGRRNNAGGWDK